MEEESVFLMFERILAFEYKFVIMYITSCNVS